MTDIDAEKRKVCLDKMRPLVDAIRRYGPRSEGYRMLKGVVAVLKTESSMAWELNRFLRPLMHDHRLEAFEIVVEAGADINTRDDYGNTLVHDEVSYSREDALRLLHKLGADLDKKNNAGVAPIWHAVVHEGGRLDQLRVLIDLGVDVSPRNERGDTILLDAIRSKCKRTQAISLTGELVNAPNSVTSETPLIVAIAMNDDGLASRLIESGASIDVRDVDGVTPLQLACRHAMHGLTSRMIQAGAQVNAMDKFGITALWWAVRNEDQRLVRMLVVAGASLIKKILDIDNVSLEVRKVLFQSAARYY